MAADQGAQQIYALLNEPTPFLYKELKKVAKAQREARNNPYGVMAQAGVDALAEVRQYYRALRTRIDEIETADTVSKTNALQSLDALDASLDAFEASLEFGISKPAVPKAKNSTRKAGTAKKKMASAIAGLSK
jgi:hypothetical protein